MCDSSKKECNALLEEYNFDHKDVSIPDWKEEIIKHAEGIYSYVLCLSV